MSCIFLSLLAIVVVSGPSHAVPTISGLMARPSHFTPNGDGVTDSTEVSFTPGGMGATVNVEVRVFEAAGGSQVATLQASSALSVDEIVELTWAPGTTPDGDYRVDVIVVDGPDSLTQSVTVTVDTIVPAVSLDAVGPNPFAPNLNPPLNELDVAFTVTGGDATTFLQVIQAGMVVDTLGTFFGAGSDTLHWDGTNVDSSAAPQGVYEVNAVASDLAGNADTVRVDVVLDRGFPVISPVGGDSLQTDTFPFTIAGTATDFDRVVSMAISVDAGSTFVDVDSISAPGPEVTWETAITFLFPTAGRYRLAVRARDAVGHETEETIILSYEDTLPAPISSTHLGGATVRDGDTIRIRSIWNLSGLDVKSDFSSVDTGFEPDAVTVVEESPGTYLIEYRVTPSNTKASGSKDIVIEGKSTFVSATDTVTVMLEDTMVPVSPGFLVSANRFDPERGEVVSVVARASGDEVSVDVYDLSGRAVRSLTGNGFVDWDGRGVAGQTVASGVYFLRIVVDEVEEVRKVAVLRGGGS